MVPISNSNSDISNFFGMQNIDAADGGNLVINLNIV